VAKSDVPAERVIGRYALYGEIAAGGMATVHFGRLLGPVGFARTVAIKRLHPQFAKDPEFVSMFLDEARLAARIQHPNVVSTLDVVALEGELFLVMEYVQGESLAKLVRLVRDREEQIPPVIASSIMTGVLYGLHAAHEAKSERGEPLGIIHRDVSPQNVLVGIDGVSRVLDFGVAKAKGRVQTTREGQIKGKISYMPPEQLGGVKMDRRTDVYAASVVLWEALTARRLFDGEHEAMVFGMVINGEIEPPSKYVKDLPSGVDDIVLKGLSRRPEDRFETTHEMAVALEDTLGHSSPRKVGEWVDTLAGASLKRRAQKVKEIESISTVSKPPPRGDLLDRLTSVDELGALSASGSSPRSERRASRGDGDLSTSADTAIVGKERSGTGTLSRVTNITVSTIAGLPSRRATRRNAAIVVALLVGGATAFAFYGGKPSDGGGAAKGREVATAEVVKDAPLVAPPIPLPEDDPPAAPDGEADPTPSADGTSAPPAPRAVAPAATKPAATKPARAKPAATKPAATKPATTTPASPSPTPPPPPAANCNPPYTVDAAGIRRIKPECL
jgi:serine/threonine protein kinase